MSFDLFIAAELDVVFFVTIADRRYTRTTKQRQSKDKAKTKQRQSKDNAKTMQKQLFGRPWFG
jgi:hypothetical protein